MNAFTSAMIWFRSLCLAEVMANAHKDSRFSDWLSASGNAAAAAEVTHHTAKLQKAIIAVDGAKIREHAADVVNCLALLCWLRGDIVQECPTYLMVVTRFFDHVAEITSANRETMEEFAHKHGHVPGQNRWDTVMVLNAEATVAARLSSERVAFATLTAVAAVQMLADFNLVDVVPRANPNPSIYGGNDPDDWY